MPKDEAIERLQANGIDFCRDEYQEAFSKVCLRTDWESALYEIKYGFFKSQLKVLYLKLTLSLLDDEIINRGSFGEILSFSLIDGQTFAIKRIKLNSSS